MAFVSCMQIRRCLTRPGTIASYGFGFVIVVGEHTEIDLKVEYFLNIRDQTALNSF